MSSLPKHIEDELQSFLKLLVPNAILLKCIHVEHGEEQHLRGNSNLNVETTPLAHVKVEIEQGQGSKLGLGLNAKNEDLIKNKELKNRVNSDLNVKALHLVHVKVKIKHGQGLGS
jgi:hypothetical protein